MGKGKVLTLEDRIPKLKAQRKQRANRRLITYISFFFLLIIGIVYFQSPLNEIDDVKVSGNFYLAETQIMDKLGLKKDAKFWTTDLDDLQAKLRTLKEIDTAEIKRVFPNDLTVKISEHDQIGYVEKNGTYYPILDNGAILDSENNKTNVVNAPILVNWTDKKSLKMMAKELKALPGSIQNRISEIIYQPTASEPFGLTLYMNDGNEVRATIINFANRMEVYPSIVEKLASDGPSIIHMTVTPWAEKFPTAESGSTEEQATMEESNQHED